MPRANDAVEAVLLEYADLLSILTEEPHRPRSYEKAARAVGGYPADIAEFDVKQLQAIPNVGSSIAGKIHEFLQAGSIGALEELRAQIPQGVRALTAIPGLGPKRAMVLYEQLGVASVDELLAAVNEGRLAEIKGFGKKTADNILRSIQQMGSSERRVLVNVALDVAEDLLRELNELMGVRRATYAGSLRRMAETIGDVDLLIASAKPGPVMDRFVSLPVVDRVIAHGDAKSSVLTTGGLQVDLRVIAEEAWGAGLMYFTGSKAHNIRLREMAIRKGLRLNEYGLFRVKSGKLIVAETEEEVYGRLGLPFIPPTLREDRGEIEAALAGELPKVLEQKDVRGDLHTHTNLTDGLAPLEEMLEAAAAMRYTYYAVTDHAPQLFMQRMTDEKMLAQRDRLKALQATYPSMTLLHGSELNIDPQGDVDWPKEFLAGFDVLVASVHTHFNLSKDEMTRRIIRAMENPYVNILGHPTARLIGKRPPIEFDLEEVFRAAARTGTALEVNGFPDRLDLKDEHVRRAVEAGIPIVVSTDAHSTRGLGNIVLALGTARRGWATAADVVNTRPLEEILASRKPGLRSQ